LSSMPKIVIFLVLYAISVSFTVRWMDAISGPSVGPTRQWEREKIPFFLTSTATPSPLPMPTPPPVAAGATPGKLRLGHRGRTIGPALPWPSRARALRAARVYLCPVARRRPRWRVAGEHRVH
jgi:hypothetical protein